MKTIRHLPSAILGLCIWGLGSGVWGALPPAPPVMHIGCEPAAMIQDSEDLTVWQDVAILSGLDVLASGNRFFRSTAAPTILLVWDASPGATGYKVYWGESSGTYHGRVNVGMDTTCALTVVEASPTVYIAVTAINGDEESDFSNEARIITIKPKLTIMRQ